MLPGSTRITTRVKPVDMPTIEAWATTSKVPHDSEAAPSRLDVTPGQVKATASLSDAAHPAQPSDTDKPASAPLPANDQPAQAAGDKPATTAAPTVPVDAPPESPRARQWITSIASSLAGDSARARQWLASTASSLATGSPRERQWIASIATSLVVLAGTWWLYRTEVDNRVELAIPAPTWAHDEESAQVKQVLQWDRDKTEMLAIDLVGVKEALQQERDKTETLASELAADLAQVRQTLQQERDKTGKLTNELAAELALVKQAPRQGDDKVEKLATDLGQVKEALQQERDRTEKLASALTADLAQVSRCGSRAATRRRS